MSETASLRQDAVAIWRAGVSAVDSERLVAESVQRERGRLTIAGHEIDLDRVGRIVVVGAGKAGAGMAAGFEDAVGDDVLEQKVSGWINVPENCVRPLRKIHLHGARPAGLNEPTEAGVAGSRKILELVRSLGPDDVCVVLISGGGSALLPAPVDEISLDDKQQVTRLLMQGGATIHELNGVRKQLSQIKGGRLAAACGAGLLITLIISDVVGDPLDIIASGPTLPDPSNPADALAILNRFTTADRRAPESVVRYLQSKARTSSPGRPEHSLRVFNHVIGNNAVAVAAAAGYARQLGYTVHTLDSNLQGEARDVGRELAFLCRAIHQGNGPITTPACILSGGEPIVRLARTELPRKGGRNQEVALAALREFETTGMQGIVILSGGTDGEDGPTDAAGAVADDEVLGATRRHQLNPDEFLAINNSYPFFAQTDGLLLTGPTHTNVMDLRVALVK